jgi:dTDP-4-dehydrorhamnose reductase
MNKKTILVTGSNGLLGQKLTESVLVNNQFNLIATAKGENRFPIKDGYSYAEMDITNADQVKGVIEKYKPNVIIHTAALTNVDVCEAEKELAFALNVTAVQTLVSLCKEFDIQLIHLSTDFVFDGANGPYDENAKANPLSYYGKTKLMGEEIVRNSKIKWAILRTIIVYGIVSDMSRSNIVLWVKAALEKGEAIKVINDQWRMPTLVEDLVSGCLLAVEHDAQGVYHISGKDMLSIAQIAYKVADFWKLDQTLITEVNSATLNQKAKRPVKTGFILDKAMTELSYKPHSFEEGLVILAKQLQGN